MTNDEWEQRMVLAATLQDHDLDCLLCAGTGGWSGIGGTSGLGTWVPCKVCNESGRRPLAGALPTVLPPERRGHALVSLLEALQRRQFAFSATAPLACA